MLGYLHLKIILSALIFKSSIFKSFCKYSFYVISISFYLNFTPFLIMFLFSLKIFVCSNFCFKFVKSYIAQCNAVNTDCILKDKLLSVRFCLQIHPLAGETMSLKLFLMYEAKLLTLITNL